MKKEHFILFVVVFMIGCQPLSSVELSTETPFPSTTPIPSETLVPSQTSSPLPTLTVSATVTSTLTSTPQPPLTAHEWYVDNVLISMRETEGDGGTSIGDLGTTWFVLYADGSLFVTRLIFLNDTYQYQVLTKKLNQKEICQHLNTLDQIGFLDYDSSDYIFIGDKPYGSGGSSILIQVNAWKSKDDSYYELAFYLRKDIIDDLYRQKGYPIVSPALQNAYYFLSRYPETGFEIYKPDRLGIWIIPSDYVPSDFKSIAQKWQLKTLPLQSLFDRSSLYVDGSNERYVELDGNEAKQLYAYLGETDNVHVFMQDNPDGTISYVTLKARPLLPYELRGDFSAQISVLPAPNSPKPDFQLSCSSSDGVLPIPIP